jgi:hypothetical protein
VAWDDGTLKQPVITLRLSTNGGDHFASAQQLSPTGRNAGFPVLALTDRQVTVAWSEQSAAAAESEMASMPNMKDKSVAKGLTPVGQTTIMMRRGSL